LKKILEKAKTGIGKNLDLESRQLFKNSTWIFISNFVGIGLAFLRSVVVARILGAESFGSYAIVVAFVGMIQEFLNLNLGTALIKFGASYHHDGRTDKLTVLAKTFLKTSLITMLVSIAAVACISFFSYERFISRPGLELFVVLYAVAGGTRYFNSIGNGMLRLYYRFKLNSVIQIIMDVVESVLVISVVLLFPKNFEIFFATVIAAAFLNGLICNVMAWWELRGEFSPYAHCKYSLIQPDMKGVRKFVVGNSLGNSLKSVMSQGDVLLLGALAGSAQVAFYAVAKKLGYAVLVLTDPLMNSVFPQFSKLLAARKFTEIKTMLRKITTAAVVPALAFLVFAYFLNEWVVTLIFGKEYTAAGPPFFWHLVGAVFSTLVFWTLPLVQSLGLIGLRLKIYTLAIVLGTAVALWLIPQMEAAGMAIALLTATLTIGSSFAFFSLKEIGKREATEA